MKEQELFRQISQRIESYRDAAIQMEVELSARPALGPENGGDGELEKSKYIHSLLEELGLEIQEIRAPDERVSYGYRPNFLAKRKGKNSSRTIWIMTHMDVVPPGDLKLWEGDPWKVRVEDRKLIGRGVEDNQQGMVSSLLAVKALQEAGIEPKYDVGLAIVSDEETGSKKGIHYVLQNHPELFRKEDLIIIPDAGNSDGTMIEVAEKSILWIRFHTRGKQAHGSMPHKGINSHKAAAHLIVRLHGLYRIYRAKDRTFEPPMSTFEPTKKEGNVPNINTIPAEDVFYLDSRILPRYTVDEVLQTIQSMIEENEKKFGVKISMEFPQKEQAAPPTTVEAPVVKALAKAIQQVKGKRPKPMGIGGGTVAAFFRRAGIPAAVWSTMDEMAHAPNEYCWIQNILDDAKVFAHVFLQE